MFCGSEGCASGLLLSISGNRPMENIRQGVPVGSGSQGCGAYFFIIGICRCDEGGMELYFMGGFQKQ